MSHILQLPYQILKLRLPSTVLELPLAHQEVAAPTVTRTREIPGTVYAFFGKEDASIPPEQVDEIEKELEKYKIPHRVFRYDGADRGFFCDLRASYNPKAAADAWEQVKQLFGQLN